MSGAARNDGSPACDGGERGREAFGIAGQARGERHGVGEHGLDRGVEGGETIEDRLVVVGVGVVVELLGAVDVAHLPVGDQLLELAVVLAEPFVDGLDGVVVDRGTLGRPAARRARCGPRA